MKEKVCPCCQQTLPPEYDIKLPPGPNILFQYVRQAGKHGIRSDRLFTKLYIGVRDGGPGFKTLGARVYYLNQNHLLKRGLKVQGEFTGGAVYGRYRLINVV